MIFTMSFGTVSTAFAADDDTSGNYEYVIKIYPGLKGTYNKSSNNKQIPQISYLLVQLKERKISATEIEDFDKLNLSTQLSSVLGM